MIDRSRKRGGGDKEGRTHTSICVMDLETGKEILLPSEREGTLSFNELMIYIQRRRRE